MSGTFTVYSTPWCGYCHRLKGQLKREGIEFDEVDIEAAARCRVHRRAGQQRQPDRPDAGLRRRHRTDQPQSVAQVKAQLASVA